MGSRNPAPPVAAGAAGIPLGDTRSLRDPAPKDTHWPLVHPSPACPDLRAEQEGWHLQREPFPLHQRSQEREKPRTSPAG